MTPETYEDWIHDPALVVGKSFSDPVAGLTITPQWVNGTSAGVTVTFGQSQPTCAHALPAVTLSPSSQSGQAGAPLTYSVSVKNNDTSACSATSVSLQAAVPAGWTAAFAASSLTISPGQNASAQ